MRSFRSNCAVRKRHTPANIWPRAASTPEQIAEFRIGYAPDSGFLLRDAVRGQFDEELLRESGLFSWKAERRGRSGARGLGPDN